MHFLMIVGMVLVVALYLAALVFAIRAILDSPVLNRTEQFIWVVCLFAFPVVAPIMWFAAGPHPFGVHVRSPLD